jgi:membrane protein
MDRVYRRGRAVWDAVMRDEITLSASSFAYHMIFAMPPLIILIVTIAALVSQLTTLDITTTLQRQVRLHAPPETRQILLSVIDQALIRISSGGASLGVIVTTVLALWSGSNAVGTLLRAFNLAYGVEVAFTAVVFGHRLGRTVADTFALGDRFDRVWNLLTIPTGIVAIVLLLAVLYYAGPNVDLSFRWLSPGSLLATALWLGAAALFGIYLRIFDTGSAYGALGSVVVLLLFLYVTGLAFLLGAKLNAEFGKRYDPVLIADLATSDKTVPGMRASARRRFRNWLARGAVRSSQRPP